MVASTGRLAESRFDANWTPGDSLFEADMADDVTATIGRNADFLFVDQFDEQRTTLEIDDVRQNVAFASVVEPDSRTL